MLPYRFWCSAPQRRGLLYTERCHLSSIIFDFFTRILSYSFHGFFLQITVKNILFSVLFVGTEFLTFLSAPHIIYQKTFVLRRTTHPKEVVHAKNQTNFDHFFMRCLFAEFLRICDLSGSAVSAAEGPGI